MSQVNLNTHNRLALLRSPSFDKRLIENIFMYIGISALVLYLLFLGMFLHKILFQIYPDSYPISVFNSAILYIIFGDLLLRSLIQKLPKANIIPYLALPIRRKKLSSFLVKKSFFSFLNFYLLLVIIPFLFRTQEFTINTLIYLLTLVSIITINQSLTSIVKIEANRIYLYNIIPILLVLIIITLRFYFKIHIGIAFGKLFDKIIDGNIFIATIILILSSASIHISKHFFKILILNEIDYSKKERISNHTSKASRFFDLFGVFGEFMQLEMRLIFRNKRPKQYFYISIFFIFYWCFLFMQTIDIDSYLMQVLGFSMLSLIFVINHGQLMISWESSYFDFLKAYPNNFYYFLKSKYIIFLISEILIGIVFLPFVYIMNYDLLLYLGMINLNMGMTNLIIIMSGTMNSSRVDLNKSAFANWQGAGVNQIIMVLIAIAFPMGISSLINIFLPTYYSSLTFIAIGIIFLLLNKRMLMKISLALDKSIYIKLENFRK